MCTLGQHIDHESNFLPDFLHGRYHCVQDESSLIYSDFSKSHIYNEKLKTCIKKNVKIPKRQLIYNYMCNQCPLTPLRVCIRIPLMARCTRYNINKVCQWRVIGRWLSPSIPIFSTNTTDFHDIFEILLKVVLNTISPKRVIRSRKSKNDRQYMCKMAYRKRT